MSHMKRATNNYFNWYKFVLLEKMLHLFSGLLIGLVCVNLFPCNHQFRAISTCKDSPVDDYAINSINHDLFGVESL